MKQPFPTGAGIQKGKDMKEIETGSIKINLETKEVNGGWFGPKRGMENHRCSLQEDIDNIDGKWHYRLTWTCDKCPDLILIQTNFPGEKNIVRGFGDENIHHYGCKTCKDN